VVARGNTCVTRSVWLYSNRRKIFFRNTRRRLYRGPHGSKDSPTDPILRYSY
jgi:hypothetical protein